MILVEIAATGKNRELGLHGDMPWKRGMKKDLSFFRKMTLNHPVVMGANTLLSMKGPLPNRENIVLSSRSAEELGFLADEITVLASVEEFLSRYREDERIFFVIGGASIYSQFLADCDHLLLTEIDQDYPADVWFPEFDSSKYEREILARRDQDGLPFEHVLYSRKHGIKE